MGRRPTTPPNNPTQVEVDVKRHSSTPHSGWARQTGALALFAALFLVPPTPLATQEAGDPPPPDAEGPAGTFAETVDVQVINVEVFVTDPSGQPVAGLSRDDFELRLDGEIVPVSNFYAEAGGRPQVGVSSPAAPADSSFVTEDEAAEGAARRAHVIVLIDHSRLGASNRKRAFKALRDAIGRLGAEDLVAVVGVERSLVFYSDFLFDRRAVDRILDDAAGKSVRSDIGEFERRQIFGELARGQSGGIQAQASQADQGMLISRIRAYAAEEYARSVNSLRQIEQVVATLAGLPGRKAILYLGEGIPNRPGEGLFVEWINRFGSGNPGAELGLRRFDFNTDYERSVGRFDVNDSMRQLAETANRAGVTLYAVDAEGNHGGDVRSALTEQGATSETISVVDENFRVPLEYASAATGGKLLRSSGLLGEQLVELLGDLDTFYSLGFTPPASWSPGTAHDLEVRVGVPGLVVRHREAVRMPEPDEREAGALLAALRYQTADNPLRIAAALGQRAPIQEGTAALQVSLEIPVGNLGFVPGSEVYAGSLTIYVSTKNAAGEASRVQKIPFRLDIPADMIEQAQGDKAHYPLPVVLRAGDQQVAIGIRDNVTGIFSAVRLDVSSLSRF